MILTLHSLEDINEKAVSFLNYIQSEAKYKNSNVIAFYGKMGVGKTTFIKAICSALGVEDEVNSPTFALINEYFTAKHESVYHFDFYRINSVEEAFDFGYEDYFYSSNFCLVEWPELIENLLPEHHIKVQITENEDGTRTLTVD